MGFATQENFETYDLYSVYRDPIEVFTSWYSYIFRNTKYTQEQIANMEITEENRTQLYPITLEEFLEGNRRPKSQSYYVGYERIQLVDYNSLSNEIEAIIKRYNGTFTLMSKMNTYRLRDDVVSDELKDRVKEVYKEDYELQKRIVSFAS